MRMLAFDTETYLIQPTDAAPKPVCCSFADARSEWLTDPGSVETLATWHDGSVLWVGQNIAYDLVLMMRWYPHLIPPIIQALDEGRVFDTGMRERMLHLKDTGTKGYDMFPSLAKMTLKYLNKDVSKDKEGDDIWRLKYGTLDGVPFDQWPSEARRYAMDDARHTYDVFQAQGGVQNIQPTEQLQVRSAVVLRAIGVWGFAINQEKRAKINDALAGKIKALHNKIDTYGWTGKGSQQRLMDLVAQAWHFKHFQFLQTKVGLTGATIDLAVWQQYIKPTMDIRTIMQEAVKAGAPLPGITFQPNTDWMQWYKETIKSLPEVPMTKKGVSIAGEVLEQLGDVVKEFADYTELRHMEKMVENYIAPYENPTVHPTFVPLVTTGRTGCRTPNTQNVPRKDKDRPDEAFRTMFQARPGRVLGTVDYSQLELCTLAATIRIMFPREVCTLGDAIDSGKDVHCMTGALVAGLTYDQMIAGKKAKDPHILNVRQSAKSVNFGKPGGLGIGALIGYAKNNYGVTLDRNSAWKIISAWERTWPEIPGRYLKYSADMVESSPTETFTAFTISGRPKANCIYTEGSNFPFQGLAADGAKTSLWAIWREAMLGWYWSNHAGSGFGVQYKDSPLRESRLVNFVHDEIVAEHPEGDLGKAALKRQEQIMVAEMEVMCQHKIKIGVEGNLSDAWEH